MDHVPTEEAVRRAELMVDVQSEIIDDYQRIPLGPGDWRCCARAFDGQVQMFFGRSYAEESPDIAIGRHYFTAA